MASLRDLELLSALARHGHFARAAEECGISQPAFSARIRALETDLGVPVVLRGNRFGGFTQEGMIALKWAHRMLNDADGLRQELEAAQGTLLGRLKMGVVPTALMVAARAPRLLRDIHPGIVVEVRSQTSNEILRGIESFSLDLGLTYLDRPIPEPLRAEPLYEERYALVAPREIAPRLSGTATWVEAAALPLCLLVSQMRNRMILDETFSSVGVTPSPVAETNAFSVAIAQVDAGIAATILPQSLAETLTGTDMVALPLTDPVLSKPMGLIFSDRDPMPPRVVAIRDVLRKSLSSDGT